EYALPQARKLDEILVLGRQCGYVRPALGHDDLACLQYTGGTTGLAKGALLSHGNLVANVHQAHAWVKPYLVEGEECIVTAQPLYRIFALPWSSLTIIKLGASTLRILTPRDDPGFVHSLTKANHSSIKGVNTPFNALLTNTDFAKPHFSCLKLTLRGGKAV